MNFAKLIRLPESALARNTARNSGEGRFGETDDDPIYKCTPMATVGAMFKRILTFVTGAMLGIAFAVAGLRMATAWNFWPNRDLSRAAGYVKDVMRLVSDNYFDE